MYTSIFHYKALQNLPKLGFLVWKQTIWKPCLGPGLWYLVSGANTTIMSKEQQRKKYSGAFQNKNIHF
jgi:hypothetical protein